MATILFPGRHLVNTRFQEEYLDEILGRPVADNNCLTLHQRVPQGALDSIVFAITSKNQAFSRYNPLEFWVRAVGVDRFAQMLRSRHAVSTRIIGIPHFPKTDDFAQYTIKEISEATEGELVLTPENTVVLCSTPKLIELYLGLGFAVLPAELTSRDPEQYRARLPVDLVKEIGQRGGRWHDSPILQSDLSDATKSLLTDFPEIPKTVARIYREPLLTESGSLTETRNYSTYAFGMAQPALLEMKFGDIHPFVVPGRIVDEGCADGALLARVSKEFPDADLIGIEITGEFLSRCLERQRAGEFRQSYVHFHQRNLMHRIFEPSSIDTTICNSTTHELWSYCQQEETLRAYLRMKYEQLRNGGRLVIRDVVGPEDKDQMVYLWCDRNYGAQDAILERRPEELSTHARFKRFAHDFLRERRERGLRGQETLLTYTEEVVAGESYFVCRLKDAVEFMTKKDYTDNWDSELNEEFAFWSLSEWKGALHDTGFVVLENPDGPLSSRVYRNPWIVENRWRGKVALYHNKGIGLEAMEYPVTNMVLVGEKA